MMTFEEWWKQLHPAEVDELKPVFEDCWKQAKRDALLDAADTFEILGGPRTSQLRRMAEELK
jgi:hypothetical protein